MKIKINRLLLIFSALLFLIIFPYTKEIELFKAEDLNWEIISNSREFKQFDPSSFSFMQKYMFTEEVINLDNSNISIKGFIKYHKHGDHNDILLTEKVTDVCFMCDHDEHYNMIKINSFIDSSEFRNIKEDTYIQIQGIFKINTSQKDHPVYRMENVVLKDLIN